MIVIFLGFMYKQHNEEYIFEDIECTIKGLAVCFLNGNPALLNQYFSEDAIFVYQGKEIDFDTANLSATQSFNSIKMNVVDFQIGPENELKYKHIGGNVAVTFNGFFEVKDTNFAPKLNASVIFKRDNNSDWKITRIESNDIIFKYYFFIDQDVINQMNEKVKAKK